MRAWQPCDVSLVEDKQPHGKEGSFGKGVKAKVLRNQCSEKEQKEKETLYFSE